VYRVKLHQQDCRDLGQISPFGCIFHGVALVQPAIFGLTSELGVQAVEDTHRGGERAALVFDRVADFNGDGGCARRLSALSRQAMGWTGTFGGTRLSGAS
jgi:hypothetical protein